MVSDAIADLRKKSSASSRSLHAIGTSPSGNILGKLSVEQQKSYVSLRGEDEAFCDCRYMLGYTLGLSTGVGVLQQRITKTTGPTISDCRI
jgi:hypothetical protein